jgi:hypothetical protein
MDLEQLNNEELVERYEILEGMEDFTPNAELSDAIATLGDLGGFQDADNSRQILINFIREEESSRQPRSKRRIEGGRRRSRSRKGKKSKRRKTRKTRKIKSRKTRR